MWRQEEKMYIYIYCIYQVYNNRTSIRFSTTIGVKPAATMAFKQDFWSILGQTIALAAGLEALSAENVRDSDILFTTGHGMKKKSPKNEGGASRRWRSGGGQS